MHWPRFAAMALVTALLQASWVDSLAMTRFHAVPDLLLILMVFYAVRCDPAEAIISSFTLGLAADILAIGSPMGPQILSFGLLGTGLAYMNRVIAIRKIPYEALAILAAGFSAAILAKLLMFLAGQSPGPGGLAGMAGTAIYSAILGPFLFILLDWIMHLKRSPRRHG